MKRMSIQRLKLFFFLFTAILFLFIPYGLNTQSGVISIEGKYVFADHELDHFGPDESPDGAESTGGSQVVIDPSDRFEGLCSVRYPRTWLTICWSEPIYNISNTFLIMAGAVFDYMLEFTLDTCVLASQGIRSIWSDMRDIANLAFILGLIFISFSLITGAASSKARGLFVRLIIIAFVLNFSLFASKVIIDAGNITALTFYNAIDAGNTLPYNYDEIGKSGSVAQVKDELAGNCTKRGDPKSIAGALVGLFNPARIFASENFESLSRAQARNQSSILMAMFLGGAVINILMAKEVFLAGFLFISRTMWLIILMVLSPLAFVSYFLPGQDYLKKWFNMIVNRSFCVVAYLFFLWLIIKITQGLFSSIFDGLGTSNQKTWSAAFILVVIQFAIVFGILKIANKTAMKMCDDGSGFGAALQKAGKAVVGLGVGVATGGVGTLARGTIGRAASNTYRARGGAGSFGERLAAAEEKGSFRASVTRRALKTISNKNFGTGENFEGRRDREADLRFDEANKVENINVRRRTRENKANIGTEKGQFRNEEEARKAAINVTRKATNDSLQAKAGSVNGSEPGSIIARMGDSVFAGLTNASDEALQRRLDSEKKDVDKKAAQEKLVEDKQEAAEQASFQNLENTRAAVAGSSETVTTITNNESNITEDQKDKNLQALAEGNPTPEQSEAISTNTEFNDAIGAAYGRTVNADGEEKFKSERGEKSYNQLMERLNTDLKDISQTGARDLLDARQRRKREQELLENSRKDNKIEGEELAVLKEILKDMEENNEQTSIGNESRRKALRKAGITISDDQEGFSGSDNVNALRDSIRQKSSAVNDSIANLQTRESNVDQLDLEIKKIQDDVEKKVSDTYNVAVRSAKSRLTAKARAGDAIDVARADRIEEDSRA